ncbi:MAG: LysM peptidoglycan-binding domain-containing protein, partial [Desulfofustis sp.]|nr:LysM peptidoglycan-binding domain-containing protein [Desulfofustis sp.]
GDIAPEWKADYKDTGPIRTDIASKKVSGSTSYLPWILVIILLIPLCYFVYETTQRKQDDENLVSAVERRLLIIEEQIHSLQNSLDLLTSLEGQLNDLQLEVSNITNRLPTAISIERIRQQINDQNNEIERITQKIQNINESNLNNSEKDQQKIEEQQYYVVQKGDNLFQISSKNKITMQKLKEINGIGPDEAIFPGQRLLLE